MSKRAFNTVRTHKKKFAFAGGCVALLGRYLYNTVQDKNVVTEYARAAALVGAQPIGVTERPPSVVVLLNRWAKDGKARAQFQSAGEHLLHLSGTAVSVLQPQSAAQLVDYAAAVDTADTDALLVVGGDGTLSQVLTGLLRPSSAQSSPPPPLAVYPCGRDARSVRALWRAAWPDVVAAELRPDTVEAQCAAAAAVYKSATEGGRRRVNLLKVQIDDSEEAVYALHSVHIGAFEHADSLRQKYWYWGALRHRFTYAWNALKRRPAATSVQLRTAAPCAGCATCRSATTPTQPAANDVGWLEWLRRALFSVGKSTANGKPRDPVDELELSARRRTNSECGVLSADEQELRSVDILVLNDIATADTTFDLLAAGAELGRRSFVADGWSRDELASADDAFYETRLRVGAVEMSRPADDRTVQSGPSAADADPPFVFTCPELTDEPATVEPVSNDAPCAAGVDAADEAPPWLTCSVDGERLPVYKRLRVTAAPKRLTVCCPSLLASSG